MNVMNHPIHKLLQKRIAIIDGAMGTTLRTYGVTEAHVRGNRFVDSKDLLNNGDLFSLTQPKIVGDIHRRFLEAGADIVETNTFGATARVAAQSEFFVDDPRERGGRKDPAFYQKIIEDFLDGLAWEINEQSARRTSGPSRRERRHGLSSRAPSDRSRSRCRTRPTPRSRASACVTRRVKAAYLRQVRALIAGGSDILLVETIFDSLNAKAASRSMRCSPRTSRTPIHDLGSGRARRGR